MANPIHPHRPGTWRWPRRAGSERLKTELPAMRCVLVTFDCLPVTALSCYGNPWAATPAFNRLACAATVFENHFTPYVPRVLVEPDPPADLLAQAGIRLLEFPPLAAELRKGGASVCVVTDRPLAPDVAQSCDELQTVEAPVGWDVANADSRPARLFEAATSALQRLNDRDPLLLWVRSSGAVPVAPSQQAACQLQEHLNAYRQQTLEALLADRRRKRPEGQPDTPIDDFQADATTPFVDCPSLFLRFGSHDTAKFHQWASSEAARQSAGERAEQSPSRTSAASDTREIHKEPAPLLEHWLFDACVTQLDSAFAPFLAACERLLDEHTLLLVAGLFGRERGERAWVDHLRSLRGAPPQPPALVHEELTHVPLWAAGALFRPAERTHALTQTGDVASAVREHLFPGAAPPATPLRAQRSNRRLVLRGEDRSVAVRTREYLLVRLHPVPTSGSGADRSQGETGADVTTLPSGEITPGHSSSQLFLKPEDRWEVNDVSDTHAAVCEELSQDVQRHS